VTDIRVIDALHLAYANLRSAWWNTLQDPRIGENSPSSERLIGPEGSPHHGHGVAASRCRTHGGGREQERAAPPPLPREDVSRRR
jgi:hypothetical protein